MSEKDTSDPEATALGSGPAGPVTEQIGRYRLLRKLGEGGMGEVYEAEQIEPVRRNVALKIIKRGMDTDQVVHRFESERQALALMDHPNIARVYDAGATEDGRPFFAMEVVRGVPITEYCDQNRLEVAQRLRLFIQVCEGVQHAHQKGIIHRDIKPSNVIVHSDEDRHIPKIIDFGIAKAMAHSMNRETSYTETGQLIGTPEYMSPEQAEMRGLDIDTRTDVYLLGVLLYRLLTGELPFPAEQLVESGIDEFRRKILEDQPTKPSARVTAIAEAKRPALSRKLRGDLDWIVMKALEKDRARRYASASEFARDVERHLGHEPVLASPPSKRYLMRKFVRRHKTGVAFAVVLTILVAGFAVTMAVQRNRVALERDRANASRITAETVVTYLVDLFRFADPHESLGDTVTARQLLDRGTRSINDLEDQPAARAQLLAAMGGAWAGIGQRESAIPLFDEALTIYEEVAPRSLEGAQTRIRLADLIRHHDFEKAQQDYEKALAILQELLPEDAPLLVSTTERVGIMYAERGNYAEAELYLSRVFEIRESRLGADHPDLAISLTNLAMLLKRSGNYDEAEEFLLRAFRLTQRHQPATSPSVASAHERLGSLYDTMGNFRRARTEHAQALKIRRVIYGEEGHPQVASNLMSLAIDSAALGEQAEAEKLHNEAMEIYRETESLDIPFELFKAAEYAALTGSREEALAHLQRACVVKGYSNAQTLLADAHLNSLHGDPEFESIVDAVRRRTGER